MPPAPTPAPASCASRPLELPTGPVPAAGSATTAVAPRWHRRLLIGSAALAAGATQLARTDRAAAADATDADILHLLRRATYGPTPALLAAVRSKGMNAWLEAQLAPSTLSDPVADAMAARFPRLKYRIWEVREKIGGNASWDFMLDTVRAHLARALWSERQLFEVTVDFWTNHLVVPIPSSEAWDNGHLFQRDVIRKHAFGRYADMLAASLRHPALLMTLGNANNSRKAPNENHARELLELHSVGVGQYTETDVRQSALALTGLGVDQDNGLYEYKPERRYVGALQVMGWKHANSSPEGGDAVAVNYAQYLARHPATARRLATKLAVRFVADSPPSSLVDRLAQVYLDSDTAIVPVLRALFTSAEFAAAAGQKRRTPYEDALATMRLLGLKPEPSGSSELTVLFAHLTTLGQAPMGWPAPNGYPDVAAYWTSGGGTLARWNFHMAVAAGWSMAAMPRPALSKLLPSPLPGSYRALLDALASALLLGPLTSAEIAALCRFVGKAPTDVPASGDSAVGVLLPYLVAMLLDSPAFATR